MVWSLTINHPELMNFTSGNALGDLGISLSLARAKLLSPLNGEREVCSGSAADNQLPVTEMAGLRTDGINKLLLGWTNPYCLDGNWGMVENCVVSNWG